MKNPEMISFTKMHALGNDFVIIEGLAKPSLNVEQLPVAKLADRHLGIGFDQLLIVEPSSRADFFCRIFNADGSEAAQCGNGLRCVARHLHEENLCKKSVTLETKAGIFPIYIEDYQQINVTMGIPTIENKLFKLRNDLPISLISLGNSHAILRVNSIEDKRSQMDGQYIYEHPTFPRGINVGLMEVINESHIGLRTLERGVGETCACGSNACAAACAGIINGWIKNKVTVLFKHGSLVIDWQGIDKTVQMIGPATRVFSGTFSF